MNTKMNQKVIQDPDDQVLDELIAMCEEHMVSPLKKKKVEVVVAAEPDAGDADDTETDKASDGPSLPEGMDLQDLIEMYSKLKDAE